MSLTRCGQCGVPKRIAFMHRWRDDGILESRMGGARGILVEREVFAGALEHIESTLGMPIDHIIIDAKRRDAKLYVDDVVSGIPGIIARLRPFRRLGYIIMIRQAAMIGLAKAELVKYKPGKKFIGRVDPVYHPILFVGDVCGAFESLEKKRARPLYGRIGEAWFSELYVDETLPREDRLELEKTPEAPARAGLRPLRRLRRSPGIERFPLGHGAGKDHRPDHGRVDHLHQRGGAEHHPAGARAGTRRGHTPHGLQVLLRDVSQAGREQHPSSYLEDLSFMKLRGFGVPDKEAPSRQDLEAGIIVRNAFNAPIIAGLVAAVCGGDEAEFAWETPEPGVIAGESQGIDPRR